MQARAAAGAAIATPLPSQGSQPMSIPKPRNASDREESMCEGGSLCLLQVQSAPVASLPGQPRVEKGRHVAAQEMGLQVQWPTWVPCQGSLPMSR